MINQQQRTDYREQKRLAALARYNILHTLPEKEYDDITRIAGQICQTPISLISFIEEDRQWFKSVQGLNFQGTARSASFCARLVDDPSQPLIVPDARRDERFSENPLVTGAPNIVFYAGVPLIDPDGNTLGSLCVIDQEKRELNEQQVESLRSLANLVMKQLELRLKLNEIEDQQRRIESYNAELRDMAYVLSHDIKGPLLNAQELFKAFIEDFRECLSPDKLEYLDLIEQNLQSLRNLVFSLLEYHTTTNKIELEQQAVSLEKILEDLIVRLRPDPRVFIIYPGDLPTVRTIPIALEQILYNLVSNAIKYNDKDQATVRIDYERTRRGHVLKVSDNGIGIQKNAQAHIFNMFTTLQVKDRFQKIGTGIGLAIVRNLCQKLGATVAVESTVGVGSTFTIEMPA